MKTKLKKGIDELLTDLDEQQVQAVTAPIDRPVVVLAGPGSGKTRVLAHRIAWMVEDQEIDPASIVAVTFSTSAATEIYNRADVLLQGKLDGDNISTIHAFCRRLLEDWYGKVEKVDDWKVSKVIKQTCRDLHWNIGWRKVKWWIERAKTYGVIDDEELVYDGQSPLELFYCSEILDISEIELENLIRCYRAVEEFLSDESGTLSLLYQQPISVSPQVVTFPDMLNRVWQRLSTDQELLESIRSQYQYILIDEGQDTSSLAMRIFKLICPDKIFIVGDPDQTLFRFAGSVPEDNLYRLADAGAMVIKLDNNYRSGTAIVGAASRLISYNYGPDNAKYQKDLTAVRKFAGEVKFANYQDAGEEASAVADEIESLILSGYEPADFYIAARTNAQLVFCERELARREIPYAVPGANGFFHRHHILDVLGYFELIVDPNDRAFERIYNIASSRMLDPDGFYLHHRWLGRRFLDECNSRGKSLLGGARKIFEMSDTPYRVGLRDLFLFLDRLKMQDTPSDLIRTILDECYLQHYKVSNGLVAADPGDDDNVLADLQSLQELANAYDSNSKFLGMVRSMQQGTSKPRRGRLQTNNVVVLASIHKLKGRERPVVFGIGWSEGLLPHRASFLESVDETHNTTEQLAIPNFSSIQDERCLAYVCLTRAQDLLYLSSIAQWNGQELEPSRFLKEIE